ncbi:armadillo-type protein [Lipomyces tetrasporus]
MLPQVFHPSTYSYPPLYRSNQQPTSDTLYGQGIAPGPPVPQAHPHQHQHTPSQPNLPQPSAANLIHRTASSRRQSEQDVNRFANVMLESLANEIYSLCKDQHGCRYLQKKLEERNPTYLNMIFNETYPHVVELMIDPFGNYLCQKLLEHAGDEQRTILVETAAPQLVKIALNQHGTRALQKMIEHVSTPEQIRLIVNALKTNVVELIQDLNGNHVIQKCLNRLSTDDAQQFIFDAVSANCVAVGTHRHGCCVLQRCIDHASDAQKQQLVNEITTHAFTLVQDPFGNYVTQYVLDLCDAKYSDPLIRRFAGNVCTLSMQKFSSNVIEKCIRIAEPGTRKILIDELLSSVFLEKLLRDSFANYVIQTAIDYADPQTRQVLVDVIRPILPSIRNTPYGRRIQSKIIVSPAGTASGSANGNGSSSPFQGYARGSANSNGGTNMLSRRIQGLEIQDSNAMQAVNGNSGSAYTGSSSGQQSNAQHQQQPQTQNGQHHQRQQAQHHQGHPHYFTHQSVHQPLRNAFTNGDFSGYNYM